MEDMFPRKIILDDFFNDLTQAKYLGCMNCDIYEENNKYYIEMDVPGFTKEDILVECEDGYLKIKINKNYEENTERKYLHHERKMYEKCERSFYLGNTNEEEITANFKDGILTIVVPKNNETSLKKQIFID